MGGVFDHNNPFDSLLYRAGLASALRGEGASTLLGGAIQAKKRKAFFSFHYDDIMRVNNVRKSWEFIEKDSSASLGFYDFSLWESRKRTGDNSLKNLIRDGVQNTSAVCVLV